MAQMDSKTAKSGKTKKNISIVFKGKVLDLTNWINRHPGGAKVLHAFNGRDATEQFDAFHSPEAHKRLDTMLKNAPAVTPAHPAYEDPTSATSKQRASFAAFKDELIAKGKFKVNIFDEVFKVCLTLGLWCLGAYLLSSTAHAYTGAFFLALGMQQCGWTGHDYSHHGVFTSPDHNNYFAHIFAWCQGYEMGWWKARHNPHHVMTNEVGNDPDIKTAPLLTYLDNLTNSKATKGLTWLQRQQHLYFVPVLGLLHVYWRIESAMFIAMRLPKMLPHALILASHYCAMYYLFSEAPGGAIATALALKGLFTGICVFSTHYGEERLPKDHNLSFAAQTVRTSRNINGGYLMNLFSGDISLQIEHHLFPMMPTSNYTSVQPLVKAWCKQQGLGHNSDTLVDCVKLNMAQLKETSETLGAHGKKTK